MKINKIQPIARVTKAGLLLTSMIILSGSLFGQDDKKIEDAEIYGAIGMMFAEGSGLAKMKFTEEQIDLILTGMKKGITLGKMPPEAQALMPKVQQIMMEKMKNKTAKIDDEKWHVLNGYAPFIFGVVSLN